MTGITNQEDQALISYMIYLYNIPQVSADGTQALPVPESQTQTFVDLDQAQAFAQNKS